MKGKVPLMHVKYATRAIKGTINTKVTSVLNVILFII